MYFSLTSGEIPQSLRSGILIDPITSLPRYWVIVWATLCTNDLADNTKIGKLRAIESLYTFADANQGANSLDDALGRLNYENLTHILESWFISLANQPDYQHADEQRWQIGLGYVLGIINWISKNHSSNIKQNKIAQRLQNLKQLYRQLHIRKRTQGEIIRSLPASVVEALYSILDPESSNNPFVDQKMKWRIYISFILMLHQGLRRGEILILPVDCIKAAYDKKQNRQRFWLNVRNNQYDADDIDERYSRPSIKTVNSIRQIPVSETVAKCIQIYVENYRGRPEHPYLLNSKWNKPLSTESITKAFNLLTKSIPNEILKELQNRTSKVSISPHDLRHTSAVVRLQQLLEKGDSMDEALQKLRTFFGWSKSSAMPLRYARAVFEDRLSSVWNSAFDDKTELLRAIPYKDNNADTSKTKR